MTSRYSAAMLRTFALAFTALFFSACTHARPPAPTPSVAPETDAARTLDAFHQAASRADEAAYLGLFANDGVFLGTDASERWSLAEFRVFVHEHFSKGQGWTYVPESRHLAFSPDRSVAWFDELLRNEKHGQLRGSGVLVLDRGQYRLAQYNLTFLIPNAIARDVVKLMRSAGVAGDEKSPSD